MFLLRIALLSPPRFAWISALIHSPTPLAIVTPTLASARYPTPTVAIVVGIVVFAGVLAFATDGCLPAQGLALAAAKQTPMATEALPKLDLSVVTTGGDHHEGGTESVVYMFCVVYTYAWCIRISCETCDKGGWDHRPQRISIYTTLAFSRCAGATRNSRSGGRSLALSLPLSPVLRLCLSVTLPHRLCVSLSLCCR